ncbi:hypothetical protein AAVH_39778, partial [Aphelenchoides avenae]
MELKPSYRWFYDNFGRFTNKVVRPCQGGLAFFLHGISLFLFLRIGVRMFRSKDVSVMLKAFILAWIIEDILAMPYSLFFALFWRPQELDYYWDVSNL